ncbi:MAG: dihydroneopterin aldolase [Pseudomonadota bacterium]
MTATVELTGLELATDIGTYGPNDVVPDVHILDMTLTIDPALVLIDDDVMERVFDYDPLIAEIDRLARDQHYTTQEYLMTRIVHACAAFAEIKSVELSLTKRPVLGGSGTLGVRVSVDGEGLAGYR